MAHASHTPIDAPAPWRYISAIQPDGAVIYYASSTTGCFPSSSSRSLSRKVFKPTNYGQTYIGQPTASLSNARILFIVNPTAGKGKTTPAKLSQMLGDIAAILEDNGAEPVVRTTETQGHATEILKQYGYESLRQFAAVVSVGGDGTLHEVVTGLVAACEAVPSVDWDSLPPLAIVPSGSGNAIAASTGLESHIHAALNIVHSLRTKRYKPLALMQYRRLTQSKRERVSVAGVQWGLPAEVDYGTEHLRWMGDMRYDLGALNLIMSKRSFRGRITVTVDQQKHEQVRQIIQRDAAKMNARKLQPMTEGLEDCGDGSYVLHGRFVQGVGWSSSKIGEGFMITPHAKITETGVFDFIVFPAGLSRMEMIKVLTNVSDGAFMSMTNGYHYFKATSVTFEEVEGQFLTIDGESVPVEPCVLEMAPEDAKLRVLDSFSDPL